MIEVLSAEELVGAKFATQLANEGKEEEMTVDQYLEGVLKSACQHYYNTYLLEDKKVIVETIEKMTKEDKEALRTQIGAPEVIKKEVVVEEVSPVVEEIK